MKKFLKSKIINSPGKRKKNYNNFGRGYIRFYYLLFPDFFPKWKQPPAMPKTWARNSSSNWAEQDPLANILVCSAYLIYFGLLLVVFGHGVGLTPKCPEMFPRCFQTAYKTGRLSSRCPKKSKTLPNIRWWNTKIAAVFNPSNNSLCKVSF